MEEMVNAGFQAPQCTAFDEPIFAADDISLSIDGAGIIAGRDWLERR